MVVILQPEIGDAPAAICVGIVGVELDRLVVVGDRRGVLPLIGARLCTHLVGIGIIRLKRDEAIEIGDGRVVIALVLMRNRAIVIGDRRLGIELHRLAEIGDAAVIVALVHMGLAAAGISARKIDGALFPLRNDFRADGDGAVDIVALAFRPILLARGKDGG